MLMISIWIYSLFVLTFVLYIYYKMLCKNKYFIYGQFIKINIKFNNDSYIDINTNHKQSVKNIIKSQMQSYNVEIIDIDKKENVNNMVEILLCTEWNDQNIDNLKMECDAQKNFNDLRFAKKIKDIFCNQNNHHHLPLISIDGQYSIKEINHYQIDRLKQQQNSSGTVNSKEHNE